MNIIDIIDKKRNNNKLSEEEISYVVKSYLSDTISDFQLSSLLMSICINELSIEETSYLTCEYIKSGIILDLSSLNLPIVDKHSTGGIGDKVSLILVPLVASCGVIVPKMSGRGLGITGGTIDKLESIPGINLNLSKEELINQLEKVNCAMFSATDDICPADKKIYNLRNLSGTTSSYGLICASILSKKIASGNKNIVIDVKYGKGALMSNLKSAKMLVKYLTLVGNNLEVNVKCIITNMNNPLGNKVGNSLEVEEAIDTLLGTGPKDLTDVVILLATSMVSMAKKISMKVAKAEIIENLNNHSGYNKFIEMIEAQGGDVTLLKKSNYKYNIKSEKNGYVVGFDINKIKELNLMLRVSKINKNDELVYENGFEILKKVGDKVSVSDNILNVYSDKKIEDFQELNNLVLISNKKKKEKVIVK